MNFLSNPSVFPLEDAIAKELMQAHMLYNIGRACYYTELNQAYIE